MAFVWPSFVRHIVSFLLPSVGWGSHKGPSSFKERGHKPHPSMGRVSVPHCQKNMWDGKYCGNYVAEKRSLPHFPGMIMEIK